MRCSAVRTRRSPTAAGPGRRHADPARPRAAAALGGRHPAGARLHLRRHAPRGGQRAAGRGERPLRAPARRRRRARLPGAIAARRQHPRAVPGPGRRPAARRSRPGRPDGELGRGGASGRPAGLRRLQPRARRRARTPTSSTAWPARTGSPAGCTTVPWRGAGWTGPSRSAASSATSRSGGGCALSSPRRTRRSHAWSRRWTTTSTRCGSSATAARARSIAVPIARRSPVARSPVARATTACGSRCCIPTTASCGSRRSRDWSTGCRSRSSTAWSGSTASSASSSTACAPGVRRTGRSIYDGATRDVSEHRRLENELRRTRGAAELRARTDELTGASNRRHFAEIVERGSGGASPTAAGSCCSMPTTSSRSTTRTAMSSGTPCSSSSRAGCRPSWEPRTAWPAGAARSSPCCCAASARTRSSSVARSSCAPLSRCCRSSPRRSACD